MDRLEAPIGYLTVSWDGLLVLTGDANIDMLKPLDSRTVKYRAYLMSSD